MEVMNPTVVEPRDNKKRRRRQVIGAVVAAVALSGVAYGISSAFAGHSRAYTVGYADGSLAGRDAGTYNQYLDDDLAAPRTQGGRYKACNAYSPGWKGSEKSDFMLGCVDGMNDAIAKNPLAFRGEASPYDPQ